MGPWLLCQPNTHATALCPSAVLWLNALLPTMSRYVPLRLVDTMCCRPSCFAKLHWQHPWPYTSPCPPPHVVAKLLPPAMSRVPTIVWSHLHLSPLSLTPCQAKLCTSRVAASRIAEAGSGRLKGRRGWRKKKKKAKLIFHHLSLFKNII